MFLRNYDNYFVALQGFNTQCYTPGNRVYTVNYGSTTDFGDGYINQKTTSGAIETVQMQYDSYFYFPFYFNVSGICLGNGTTAETYEDYKLSGEVITNKLVAEKSYTDFDEVNHKRIMTIVASYYNNSNTEVNISEWGLFRANSSITSLSYSNSSSDVVLTFREVLQTPIRIPVGETATITFTLEIPTKNF